MRSLALALALAAVSSTAFAQAPPVQNRANAAVSGTPNLQIASAAAQPDLCTGVQTAAYGSPVLGVTLNVLRRDPECARIRKAKALQGLGYPAAGVQVLCQDGDVRAAMKAAGTPCELVKETP